MSIYHTRECNGESYPDWSSSPCDCAGVQDHFEECELCGKLSEECSTRTVDYDAMVDGPGYMVSEDVTLCSACWEKRR